MNTDNEPSKLPIKLGQHVYTLCPVLVDGRYCYYIRTETVMDEAECHRKYADILDGITFATVEEAEEVKRNMDEAEEYIGSLLREREKALRDKNLKRTAKLTQDIEGHEQDDKKTD